ncbi:MAG: thioredoxin-disulfide reductase [Planctomycetota bacterium]
MAERVVIIGSGPAGWSAAIYTARADLAPVCIEGAQTQENYSNGTLPLGQLAQTTEVENYAGFPAGDLSHFMNSSLSDSERAMIPDPGESETVTGPQLMNLMRRQAKNFGTHVITDDVTEVDFSQRPFTLKTLGGTVVKAECVIVATGAKANWLGLESENRFKNMGVSACATCDGALPRFRDKPIVVVGGGDSAMEEAMHLAKFGSRVHIVHRRDSFRASKIMADRALAHEKITVHWNTAVTEVLGDDSAGMTGVTLESTTEPGNTRQLEASGMFAAIGHTPNTDFLGGQLELTDKKYVVWTVPFRTNTSVDGVFAAGDVADDHYRQAITAAGSGCMAALDAERWLGDQGLD